MEDLHSVESTVGGKGQVVRPTHADSVSMSALSVALIGPDDVRRKTLAAALAGPQANIAREVPQYPGVDDLAEIAEADYDVVIVDVESNADLALDVVENICAGNTTLTVIAYAAQPDAELLVQCMRAGAREFLADPLTPNSVAEALVRASARREELRRHKKITGKLLVFVGAKGGSGVTTLTSNFALALAGQSAGKVALLDLDLQLGDAALTLGLKAKFSLMDALESAHRMDADLLSALMTKHNSGLEVLAAPDAIPNLQPSRDILEKVVRLAREDFAYVVVDAGAHSPQLYDTLFEAATTVYLVTQVGVAELRNANRFISWYFSDARSKKLEVVINRFVPRNLEIDEAAVAKVLTRPVKWKIPNDYAAVRRAQNTGVPILHERNPVARAVEDMARAAAGQTAAPKKKKFGLF
jgi:pilus assembly protein CpaE